MARFRLPHIIISAVATVVFTLMAINATQYAPAASWFPLYTGIAGALASFAAVVVGTIAVVRRRATASAHLAEPARVVVVAGTPAAEEAEAAELAADGTMSLVEVDPDDPDAIPMEVDPAAEALTERQTFARGLLWLSTWVIFVFATLLFGFLLASVIWLGVWFRTVYKWKWRLLLPVLAGTGVLIWMAEYFLHMAMPGGHGVLGLWFGF